MPNKYFIPMLYGVCLNIAYAQPPHSFISAKKIVYKVFSTHPSTLYCNCKYSEKHQVDLKSCHMTSAAYIKRAHITEIEHILPAENFGHKLACWQNQICTHHGKAYRGRKCCEKSDSQFRQMESELYNLWPAVGLVNIVRSNYSYGVVDSSSTFYGCDFKINKATKVVEPSNDAKGIVARATLFMSDRYQIPLTDANRQLYLSWSKQHPPSKWEKEWSSKIALIEGYKNAYIS